MNLIDPEKWDETVNTWINDLDIKVVGPDVAVQTPIWRKSTTSCYC